MTKFKRKGLARKRPWTTSEDTELAKLLERHTPDQIYERALEGPDRSQGGRPSGIRFDARFWRELQKKVAELKVGGEKIKPTYLAYLALYKEEFSDTDPKGKHFASWYAAKRKAVTRARKHHRESAK